MTVGAVEPVSYPRWLGLILVTSFALNVWGITWGLPQRWHPDELTQRAENMVGGPTLNPHYFAYGGLHYYVIAAFAVLPVKIPNQIWHLFDYDTQSTLVVTLSRVISAAMATGVVYLTYRIAAALFAANVGLLAAAFTATSMVLVNAAHFATTDVPSLFWFMVACAAAATVYRTGSMSAYSIAGLAAGLAAAVKYVGGLALITLVVAHLLRRDRSPRTLRLGIGLAVIAFIAGNPTLLFAPVEFVDGFVTENLFNSLRGMGLSRAYLPLLSQLRAALGTPSLLLAWIGLLYAPWLLGSARTRAAALLVLSMVVPYYIVVGAMRGPRAGPLLLGIAPVRYTLPLVPFVMIFGAVLCADACRSRHLVLRTLAVLMTVITIGYSTAFALAADLQFANDSRYAARAWVFANVDRGARIETTSYGPNIPTDVYTVLERPHDNHVGAVAQALSESPTYLRYVSATAPLRRWLQAVGVDAEQRYLPWSEKAEQRYAADVSRFDLSLTGLTARAPAVFIVSDLYTTRFAEGSSLEGNFFDGLSDGGGSYHEVARFHYDLPPWLNPAPEFVNPLLHVYAQQGR